MAFLFIDTGEFPDDEPVAVGPFATEDEAYAAARTPGQGYVMRLWTQEEYAEYEENLDDDRCSECGEPFSLDDGPAIEGMCAECAELSHEADIRG